MSPIAYTRCPRGSQPDARVKCSASAEAAAPRGPLHVGIAAASSAARITRREGRLMGSARWVGRGRCEGAALEPARRLCLLDLQQRARPFAICPLVGCGKGCDTDLA